MRSFKERKQEREKTRVEKRVESLPTSELLPWAEQSIYAIGRSLSVWQKTKEDYSLEEARLGAEALHVIIETIVKRQKDARL